MLGRAMDLLRSHALRCLNDAGERVRIAACSACCRLLARAAVDSRFGAYRAFSSGGGGSGGGGGRRASILSLLAGGDEIGSAGIGSSIGAEDEKEGLILPGTDIFGIGGAGGGGGGEDGGGSGFGRGGVGGTSTTAKGQRLVELLRENSAGSQTDRFPEGGGKLFSSVSEYLEVGYDVPPTTGSGGGVGGGGGNSRGGGIGGIGSVDFGLLYFPEYRGVQSRRFGSAWGGSGGDYFGGEGGVRRGRGGSGGGWDISAAASVRNVCLEVLERLLTAGLADEYASVRQEIVGGLEVKSVLLI